MTNVDEEGMNSSMKASFEEETLRTKARTARTRQTTLEGKTTWDFLRSFSVEESHEYTHGLHIYPAKIVPQIARELIAKLSNPSGNVLDPFCGSGTVLVESLVAGRNAIGTDINTLALLLAKVKTTPLSKVEIIRKMNSVVKHAEEKAKDELDPAQKTAVEKIPNLYHWFQPYVVKNLVIIRNEVSNIVDPEIRDFFYVCFSATMYNVSNIRKTDNPYFIRVFHKEEMAKHKPNVLEHFRNIVKRNSRAVDTISRFQKSKTSVKILRINTQDLLSAIGKEVADLIVTSPPYGEEKNTMDYARFSKLALYWLGLDGEHIKEMKNGALGSKLRHWEENELDSKTLRKRLEEIDRKSMSRADEVYSFFHDYVICLKATFDVLKKDSYCCIVIGDRTASGVPIPNGEITSELCEAIGYATMERLERKMYLRTLRSNVIGSENILIMKKV
jgi:DNA modification methylase